MRGNWNFIRSLTGWGVSAGILFGLSACKHEKPNVIYMPDMVYSPALKAQEEGSMRLPVKGTVSRDFEPYHYANQPEVASRELKNPVRPTASVLKRGQRVYQIYCNVCHGPAGEGDGTIVPKFPRPPSLQTAKVKNWTDGMLFHQITVGANLMPGYASQIGAADRWAIVHYVRAIQRSKNPTAADLKQAEQESK